MPLLLLLILGGGRLLVLPERELLLGDEDGAGRWSRVWKERER